MFTEQELLLILEMRYNSLDFSIGEMMTNGKSRAEMRIRQKEVRFIIEHIKNKVLRNKGVVQ